MELTGIIGEVNRRRKERFVGHHLIKVRFLCYFPSIFFKFGDLKQNGIWVLDGEWDLYFD